MTPSPAPAEQAGAEAGHDVPALVFEGHRRHRHEDVVGQHGYQRVDIGGLPCADESGHERLLGRRACGGRRLVAGGRRLSALQAGPRPLEGAVDRFDSRIQHGGYLAGVETEDVAQDQDGELARRQDLQGGDERQGDRFGLLVAGLRAERPIDHTFWVLLSCGGR
jgi:hypothetical protein